VMKWEDKLISVTVPTDVTTGRVEVIVTNDNGDASDPKQLTMASPNEIDGL